MEEPIDSFQSPKQDKMISLIAWLIIASLLFYVIVFTFESFLRKSPSVVVSQAMDDSYPEVVDTPFVIEAKPVPKETPISPEVKIVNPVIKDAVTVVTSPNSTTDGVDDFFKELASESKVKDQFVNPVHSATSASQNVVSQTQTVSALPVRSPVAVNTPTVAPTLRNVEVPQILIKWIQIDQKFSSMRAAFSVLKELRYGNLDPEFEFLPSEGGYLVMFGMPASDSEVQAAKDRLEGLNSGLRLKVLSPQEVSNMQLQSRRMLGRATPIAPIEPEVAVLDYRRISRQRPFTIQVGSFLSRQNAVALRDGLISKGFLVDVEEIRIGSQAQFRVLLGNYGSKAEASISATEISEKHELPVYVREAPLQ